MYEQLCFRRYKLKNIRILFRESISMGGNESLTKKIKDVSCSVKEVISFRIQERISA
jgi:ferredoxin-fold anticodon binding domain-containing protein